MVTVPVPSPSRGEIWLVQFEPAIGEEIRKLRPAVVVSRDGIGRLPLRIVVPLTDWKPLYAKLPWFVEVPPTPASGLIKSSGADTFQTKSVSLRRFARRLGVVTRPQMDAIANAIALCVGAR